MTVATRSPPSISAISPKNPSGPDRADLVAVDRSGRVTADDHEELEALFALAGQLVADRRLHRVRQRGDPPELVVVAGAEQPDSAEEADPLVEIVAEAHALEGGGSDRCRTPRRRRRVPTTSTTPTTIAATPTST